MQALSGMIGRKASVGGFLSPPSNPGLNPGQAVETAKLEYGRGRGNFRWSGEMRRDRKEHQRAVANALSIRLGSTFARMKLKGIDGAAQAVEHRRTLPGLDMPRILLKERGAFGNADTGGAWLSSARATAGDKPEEGEDDVKSSCPYAWATHVLQWPGQRVAIPRGLQLACMKPESLVIAGQPYGGEFVPGLVHTAVTLWELAMPNRNKVAVLEGAAGSPPFQGESPCPSARRHGDVKRKERDGVSLAFGIAGPGGRPARRAISSVEDRWGDSGEIQCRSNFLFTRGIRAVRGGPPWLLSSRESIHPLSVYGQLSLEHRDQEIGSSHKKNTWLINNSLLGLRPLSHYERPDQCNGMCLFIYLLTRNGSSYFKKTCHGKEEGGNKHTWRAQYTGELYAAFGKDESLPKRNLLILSQLVGPSLVQVQDGPAAPKKRIEEASDSFIHAPLGSGDIAQLVELRSCNWVVAITGWMSNCPGGNDSILYLNRWLTFSK
uniref:Uncharacterized protein ycf68 n=1 Tax=Salix viminalis TaxID=40686 RepID=A0A6N2N9U7_SALVM